MSRFVVARCFLWCKTGAFGRFSFLRMPLMHNMACRCYQSNRGSRKLHRRVINDRALQEQLDLMKLSVADLESADSFGSLSVDCDVDEELLGQVEADQAQRKPARKHRKSASSEVSNKADEHSHKKETSNVRQEREIKGAPQSRQPVSKHSREHRISVPLNLKTSIETEAHMEICNKFPVKESFSDLRPDRKDWSEKFGSLSDDVDKFVDKYVADEKSDDAADDECKKFVPFSAPGRRKHIPFWYGNRISKLGRAGKVYEALETLEKQMLKEDRVPPNQFVFTVLIGVLGRVGYTEKAFHIFNEMKEHGQFPEDPTYTALFNACSNSPWPADGLSRANELRQLMAEEDYTPNMMTYNAMIKAYARCGDVKSAFDAADEAVAVGHAPDVVTYSCLLMACIADPSAGLKLAIEVWRLMRRKRRRPNAIHYNLLLRAIRDCNVGDKEHIQELLLPAQQSASRKKIRFSAVMERKDAGSGPSSVKTNVQTSVKSKSADISDELQPSPVHINQHLTETNVSSSIPDLLDPQISVDSSVELRLPESAADRLMMLGGVSGMLARMDRDKAKPDVKTFSLLLDVLPLSPEAETDLLSAMNFYNVRADLDFYNMLIRKRNLRRDFAGAYEIMSWLPQKNLTPNMQTFGCLAIGCGSKEAGVQLFRDIEVAGLVPNVEVCDILLHQSGMNFFYKMYIMETMKKHKIRPNANFIKKIEQDIAHARKMVVKKERGEAVPNVFHLPVFQDGFQKFLWQYRSRLLAMELDEEVHPWAQFQQPVPSVERMLNAENN